MDMLAQSTQDDLNPNDTGTQIAFSLDFAARVILREAAHLGISGVIKLLSAARTGDWAAFWDVIKELTNDPDVKRFAAVKDSYPEAGLPVEAAGYYCVIVIANTNSGTSDWKPTPIPWGTPGR